MRIASHVYVNFPWGTMILRTMAASRPGLAVSSAATLFRLLENIPLSWTSAILHPIGSGLTQTAWTAAFRWRADLLWSAGGPCRRLARLTLVLLWAPTVTAQELSEGQRIRVSAPGFQLEGVTGKVLRLDRDSLVMQSAGERLALPRPVVTRIETVVGRHGHSISGALIGGAAAAGFVGQDMIRKPSQCRGSGNYGELCAMIVVGSLVGGALVGGLIGTAIRHDEWITLTDLGYTPSVRLDALRVLRPQLSLAIALRFW